MSILSNLFGGSIAAPIDAVGNVFDKLFTSDEEKLKAQGILEKIKQHPHILQAEISKLEATHRSMWVAGARPAIIWCCALGFFFTFIVNPIIQWISGSPGPALPTSVMHDLVISLLGLGAMRTVEKLANKTK